MALIIRKSLRISTAPTLLSLLLLSACLLLCHRRVSGASFRPRAIRLWGGSASRKISYLSSASSSSETTLLLLRGGSEAPADASVDSDAETDEEDEDKDEGEGSEGEPGNDEDKSAAAEAQEPPTTSTEQLPVNILFKTNVGHQLIDQSLEVSAGRTRDISSLKKTLSRQLPGKPPMEQIRLMQHGKILQEEMILNELLDDDDDEDEEEMNVNDEESKTTLTLVLDMVPPVDPRFYNQLNEKLNDTTTADLLEAYTLNEAAIWMSSHYWTKQTNTQNEDGVEEDNEQEEDESLKDPIPIDEDAPLVGFQLKQYANSLRTQLEDAILTNKTAPILEDPVPPAQAARERSGKAQIRGQRVRPGIATDGSGPSSSVVGLKQNAQHYLNINWGDTIRHFCLFIFFGFFGGRTVTSRAVLLLGAPMCFIIQARPVKLFLRELVYILLRGEPSFIISLLPAPQQACLTLTDSEAMRLIYGQDAPEEGGLSSSDVEDEKEFEGSSEDEDESEEVVLSDDESCSDDD